MNALDTDALHKAHLNHLAATYNNADTRTRDNALGKIKARQSAWWSDASYSNAAVGSLVEAANRLATLEDALTECEDFYSRTSQNRRIRSAEYLGRLIPLNDAAVRELNEAFREVRTFRTVEIGRVAA